MINTRNPVNYVIFLILSFNSIKPSEFNFMNVNQENSLLSFKLRKFKIENLKFNTVNSSLKTCTIHFFALPL